MLLLSIASPAEGFTDLRWKMYTFSIYTDKKNVSNGKHMKHAQLPLKSYRTFYLMTSEEACIYSS